MKGMIGDERFDWYRRDEKVGAMKKPTADSQY